jgi:hypothetical protein
MARGIGLGLACVLALGVASSAPADLLLPGLPLPSPGDVIKVIDALTKKDSDTTVDVETSKAVNQGKLLVARMRVHIALERSSRNWRGRVSVTTKVPSEITYTIDLAQIRPEHIRVDAKRHLLIVKMPPLQVESVAPLLAKMESERKYKRGRFRFFDADTVRQLENAILKEDYLAKAREVGREQLPDVREQSRATLQNFLQQVLRRSAPGVRVVVE